MDISFQIMTFIGVGFMVYLIVIIALLFFIVGMVAITPLFVMHYWVVGALAFINFWNRSQIILQMFFPFFTLLCALPFTNICS
jgi:hypothetical protein